jgi:hypothetical protein
MQLPITRPLRSPMQIACSIALRFPTSSSSRAMNALSAGPSPSSSLAATTCFSWSEARSTRKAWSCLAALETMLRIRSVTLMGEALVDPMADTTTTLPCAGSSMTSWDAPVMRSADAMQVPPNLWTTHCAPRGQPSPLAAAGAASARTAETRAPAGRRAGARGARLLWGCGVGGKEVNGGGGRAGGAGGRAAACSAARDGWRCECGRRAARRGRQLPAGVVPCAPIDHHIWPSQGQGCLGLLPLITSAAAAAASGVSF